MASREEIRALIGTRVVITNSGGIPVMTGEWYECGRVYSILAGGDLHYLILEDEIASIDGHTIRLAEGR